MLMWLYEILPPADLFRHISLFLLVLSMAMPTVALLRWVALAAGVVGVVLSAFIAFDAIGLFWSVLFVVVVAVRIVMASSWSLGRPLSKEQALFQRMVVPELSAGQVRKLLSVGRIREVPPGTALTYQGERTSELSFVLGGTVDIIVDGQRVADCGPGTLIGEISISTGDPATATAVTRGNVRYLGFQTARLYRLLDAHQDLQDAIELAVQRSLRDKLQRSNVRAAHPDETQS